MSETVAFQCPDALLDKFERKSGDQLNTHYCPGCGHGMVHKYIAEAIDKLGVQDRTIFVSPVGCSVFAYYYFDVGNIQVPHGRLPAAATAIKRGRPESIVIGYQGDGDLAAIGGNEIIQAANRGENLSIFFINNAIYGMTGGQMAPTTMLDMHTTTTPEGRHAENEGFPLRVCELLATLTAPYYLERVAIGDAKHNAKARKAITKAIRNQIENKGFSLVEILSPCPTGWKLPPLEAARFSIDTMTGTFPLGVHRDGHELNLGHPRRRTQVEAKEIPAVLGLGDDAAETPLPDHSKKIEEAAYKIAGFGGQGVLFMGLTLAQSAMLGRRQVSWIPSYGPEMRGGTAHCSVIVSDHEIGTPLAENPTVLVAMNGPSLERFAAEVRPGGTIFYNSSMIEHPPPRTDVRVVPIPVNEIADRLGNPKVGNVVMLGAVIGDEATVSREALLAALPSMMRTSAELLELNRTALDAGIEAAAQEAIPAE